MDPGDLGEDGGGGQGVGEVGVLWEELFNLN